MEEADRRDIIERYENRLCKFGYSPKTLGWGKQDRQEIRFGILAQPILENPKSTVLDVGCGFADLYDYLIKRGWRGHYSGIDVVPGLLKIARERHPNLDLRELDITGVDVQLEKADCVIASGLFNYKLKLGCNVTYMQGAIRKMFSIARATVCVDFMSTYVDFQHPDGWHTDPAWAFAFAKNLSRRIMLRHDYMPFEFALIIYRNDDVSPRNVFEVAEQAERNR